MTGITRFEPEPDTWQSSDETPPTAFTTDDHTERDHVYFATADEQLLTGVWECAPSILEIDSYPVHEVMTVLAGSVTITDNDTDRSATFTAGDTFFIEKGTRLTWEITETLRKYYVIVL